MIANAALVMKDTFAFTSFDICHKSIFVSNLDRPVNICIKETIQT